MTDTSGHCSSGIECTEWMCAISFSSSEELRAHLMWDHNRSLSEAEKFVERAVQPDTEHDPDIRTDGGREEGGLTKSPIVGPLTRQRIDRLATEVSAIRGEDVDAEAVVSQALDLLEQRIEEISVTDGGTVLLCSNCRTPLDPDEAVLRQGEPTHRMCDHGPLRGAE